MPKVEEFYHFKKSERERHHKFMHFYPPLADQIILDIFGTFVRLLKDLNYK